MARNPLPSDQPASIDAVIADSAREPVRDHWSDARVEVLRSARYGTTYLKAAASTANYPVRDEAARLDWVAGRVPGPRWWLFDKDGEQERLLTAALPGQPLRSFSAALDGSTQARLLANIVRTVHDSLPVESCQFRLSNEFQRDLSHHLHASGAVHEAYFAEVTGGWTTTAALEFLDENLRPDHLDDVVLHGDPYPGNVIAEAEDLHSWGLVDWGWCGVGDRWHDLTNVYVYLERTCGADAADHFLTAYGIERVDDALLFFRLLDGLR